MPKPNQSSRVIMTDLSTVLLFSSMKSIDKRIFDKLLMNDKPIEINKGVFDIISEVMYKFLESTENDQIEISYNYQGPDAMNVVWDKSINIELIDAVIGGFEQTYMYELSAIKHAIEVHTDDDLKSLVAMEELLNRTIDRLKEKHTIDSNKTLSAVYEIDYTKHSILKESQVILSELVNGQGLYPLLVTTESGSFLGNIPQFFTSKLNVISKIFHRNASGRTTIKVPTNKFLIEIYKSAGDIDKIIKRQGYMEARKMEIPVIIGLNTDIITVLDTVGEVAPILTELISTIDELDTFTARVNNQDHRTRTRPFPVYHAIAKNKTLHQAISKLISPKAVSDTKPVSDLIGNLQSLKVIREKSLLITERTVPPKTTHMEYMESVKKAIVGVGIRVDELEKTIAVSNTKISKVVLKELAVRLETVAMLVTNALTIYHIYNQTAMTTTHLIKRLKQLK